MTHREGTPPGDVEAFLKQVLASPQFFNARRLSEFLRLITLKAATGDTAGVDEYLIAQEIYGRQPDYDPQLDPIVRVEANRLRAKLRDYYAAEGRYDPVRLRLPEDDLVPVFESVPPSPPPLEQHASLRLTLALALVAVMTMAALVPFSRHAADSRTSIAVLPFATLGGPSGKDYFSDGLTGQITDQLGRIGKLRVVAHGSAKRFSDGGSDLRRIASRLQVDFLLEGTVRFSGDRVVVAARLYDVRRDSQVWSNQFDRPAVEVPILKDQVTSDLAHALQLGAPEDAVTHATQGWSRNPQALDLYLQARYLFNSRKPENLWKSVELYDAALKVDPNFALAYSGMAEDYVVLAVNEDQGMYQMNALARRAVTRALAIDPYLPDAYLTKAAIEDHADFANVERSYKAAMAANPSSANAHHWWGLNLLAVGRFAEAEAEIRQAQLLDPLSLYIGVHIGTVYYCSRRYQDTIDQERRILNLDPHLSRAVALYARGYEGLHRYSEATSILETLLKTDRSANIIADLGHVYAVSGQRTQAHQMMEALTRMAKTRHVSPHYLALIQAGLGNKSEALASLDVSYEQRDAPLAFLGVDPRWDPLRGEPRFQHLLHALSLDHNGSWN